MLRDDVELYTKLTGEDGWLVPIVKIGAYLDGYNKGLERSKRSNNRRDTYMSKEEIIAGLQFTIDMFLLDPMTGETFTEPRNDMNKTTIDACRGAIELLKGCDYD